MKNKRVEQPNHSANEQPIEQPLPIFPTVPSHPLRLDWRAGALLAIALFVSFGLLGMLWLFARPLALLILALAIATALVPPVNWLSKWLPRMLAIIAVYLALMGLLIGIGWLTLPPLITQIQELNTGMPATLDWVQNRIEQSGFLEVDPIIDRALTSLSGLGTQLLTLPLAISDRLLDTLLIFFLSFYALVAAPRVRQFIFSISPVSQQAKLTAVLDKIVEGMGGYLRGVFITGIFVGIATYIGLRLIGVPYPVVLSVLAGVLEFIPVIGTTISTIAATAVAATQSPPLAVATLIFMIVIQLIEGNILFPNIVGRATHSSPLLSMFAFFAGMSVGGILGGIIGVPLAVASRVLLMEVIVPVVQRQVHGEPEDKVKHADSPAA